MIAKHFTNRNRPTSSTTFKRSTDASSSSLIIPTTLPYGKPFDANAYAETLDPGHPDVQALGIPVDVATELGIGYSKKGIMRGRVVFPMRHEDGSVLGYAGFNAKMEPPLKLPKF